MITSDGRRYDSLLVMRNRQKDREREGDRFTRSIVIGYITDSLLSISLVCFACIRSLRIEYNFKVDITKSQISCFAIGVNYMKKFRQCLANHNNNASIQRHG